MIAIFFFFFFEKQTHTQGRGKKIIVMLIMRDYLLKSPEATIMVSDEMQDITAPHAAYFSSRGPSTIIPTFLR